MTDLLLFPESFFFVVGWIYYLYGTIFHIFKFKSSSYVPYKTGLFPEALVDRNSSG